MIKQYFKQALRLLTENKLLSVISILGTALAICMIMVIVILYVVNTAGFKPEVNRERTCYFTNIMSLGKEDGRRMSYSGIGFPLLETCYYPLQSAEVVTGVLRQRWDKLPASTMDGLRSYNSQVILTDTAFWQLFKFDFLDGAPFTPAAFMSGIREAVVSESVARTLFGTVQVTGKEMKLNFTVFRICGVVKDVSRFASKAWADVWLPYTTDPGYRQGWCEGINGNFQCYALLKEGKKRDDLRREAEARLVSFNSTLSDCKADMLHMPTTQVEEWLYGGNEKPQDVSRVYLSYGVVFFILLLVPALNLSSITFSRMRKRVAELGVRRAFGATKRDIVSQVLFENLALTLAGGLLGLVLSFFSLWLLRDWLLTTSLGEAGLSAGMFNGYVFLAAFFFCLVMNLMSAGIPAWRVSRVNITDSINS